MAGKVLPSSGISPARVRSDRPQSIGIGAPAPTAGVAYNPGQDLSGRDRTYGVQREQEAAMAPQWASYAHYENAEAERARASNERMAQQQVPLARTSSGPGSSTLSIPQLPPPKVPGPSYQEVWAREDKLRAEDRSRMSAGREKALAGLQGILSESSAPVPFNRQDSPELEGANALAYGRAKDRIGRERLNAVRSFQGVMDTRGLAGSTGRSFESGGVGNILAGGLDELGDVSLAQAQDTVGRNRAVYDQQVQAQERRKQIALSALAALYQQYGMAV